MRCPGPPPPPAPPSRGSQVKEAAQAATTDCFLVNGNRDIEQFVPQLVGCIAQPAQTTECIHKLAATTFVQQVRRAS